MKQSYPLDIVIRSEEGSSRASRNLGRQERRVIFDTRKGKVLGKKPFFGFGIQEYVVSTAQDAECAGPCLSLKSPQTGRSLEFQISYDARCEKGNEDRLVEALGREDHPGQVLDDYLVDQLRQSARTVEDEGGDFVVDFDELKLEVDQYLKTVAERDIGITLRADVHPRMEDKLAPIPVTLEAFEARPMDADEPVLLECSTEVEALPGARMRALLFYRDLKNVSGTVRETIRQTLSSQVSLHDLATSLSGDPTQRILIAAINEELAPQGRRIRFLRLESAIESPPAEAIEIEHEMKCAIRGVEEQIGVKHRLILNLVDLAKLVKADVDDVEERVIQRLDSITKTVMFDKTYLDLLIRFDPENPCEIRKLLEEEISSLGYAVQHIMSIPDLEPIAWKDHGFNVESSDREYATADSRVKVRLELVLHGKIGNLADERLKPYLHPRSELLSSIQDAAQNRVQEILHKIPPQTFYTEFHYSHHGESIKSCLETSIATLVEERFAVSELAVIAKPAETELTKRLAHLLRGPHRVKVVVSPLRSGGHQEPVEYHITFNVKGVADDGWHIFCLRGYASIEEELARLKEEIREQARTLFGSVPANYLAYRYDQHRLGLQKILDSCRPHLRHTFGVDVVFVQVRREGTWAERANEKAMRNNIQMQLERSKKADEKTANYQLEKLDKLHQEDLGLIQKEIPADDPDRVNIRKGLDEHTERIHPFPSKKSEEHVERESLPAGDEDFSFEDYCRRLQDDTQSRFLRLVEGESSVEGENSVETEESGEGS